MQSIDKAIRCADITRVSDVKSMYQDAERFIDDIERAVSKYIVPHRGDMNSAVYAQIMDGKIKFERTIISNMQKG